MAENKEAPKPVTKSGFSLIDPRDHFIGIAFGKLLDQAIADGDFGKYDMTAVHAVRYGDAVMRAKVTESKPMTSGVGKVEKDVPPPAPIEPPKSIAEQLTGPAQLLEEVV